jgi:hypothetical protein
MVTGPTCNYSLSQIHPELHYPQHVEWLHRLSLLLHLGFEKDNSQLTVNIAFFGVLGTVEAELCCCQASHVIRAAAAEQHFTRR